jgi:hypothetical protein
VDTKKTWGEPGRASASRHVLRQRRRVGDVVDAVPPAAAEPLAEARVILPVADDRGHTGGQAIRTAAAVEDGDLVPALLEGPEQVQADELGAAHDEYAHDRGDSIRASRSA